MLIQKAVLTHDGRALVWAAKETVVDGITSLLIAADWATHPVIGVDNRLEVVTEVMA